MCSDSRLIAIAVGPSSVVLPVNRPTAPASAPLPRRPPRRRSRPWASSMPSPAGTARIRELCAGLLQDRPHPALAVMHPDLLQQRHFLVVFADAPFDHLLDDRLGLARDARLLGEHRPLALQRGRSTPSMSSASGRAAATCMPTCRPSIRVCRSRPCPRWRPARRSCPYRASARCAYRSPPRPSDASARARGGWSCSRRSWRPDGSAYPPLSARPRDTGAALIASTSSPTCSAIFATVATKA